MGINCSTKENTVDVEKATESQEDFDQANPKDDTDSQSPPPNADDAEISHIRASRTRPSLAKFLGDKEEMTYEQYQEWEANRNIVVHEYPSGAVAVRD